MHIRDLYNEKVSKIGQPYAVKFSIKMKYLEKDYLEKLMAVMLEKVISSNDKHFWAESKIAVNISAKNIIEIKEIDCIKN